MLSAFPLDFWMMGLARKAQWVRWLSPFYLLWHRLKGNGFWNVPTYEGYYASVFYSYFAALGLDIILEDTTNQGRIDMTVKFNKQVYLFEFKVVELVPQGKALQQLQDRGYADKYRSLNQPIHLIGVEFSKKNRSVVGFEWLSI